MNWNIYGKGVLQSTLTQVHFSKVLPSWKGPIWKWSDALRFMCRSRRTYVNGCGVATSTRFPKFKNTAYDFSNMWIYFPRMGSCQLSLSSSLTPDFKATKLSGFLSAYIFVVKPDHGWWLDICEIELNAISWGANKCECRPYYTNKRGAKSNHAWISWM